MAAPNREQRIAILPRVQEAESWKYLANSSRDPHLREVVCDMEPTGAGHALCLELGAAYTSTCALRKSVEVNTIGSCFLLCMTRH